MNHLDFVKDYINQSKLRIETAETALEKNAYAYCIRQCQEAVELSLKATLRMIGIDYPKWHDVGVILKKEKNRFPAWFQKEIAKLAAISKFLAAQREAAMYGEEMSKKSPSSLFSKGNAEESLKNANFCFDNAEKLLKTLKNEEEQKE